MNPWPRQNQLIEAAKVLRDFATLIESRGEEASQHARDFLGGYPEASVGGGAGTSFEGSRQEAIVAAGETAGVDGVFVAVDTAWMQLRMVDHLVRQATSNLSKALPNVTAAPVRRRATSEPCVVCGGPDEPRRYGLCPKDAQAWYRHREKNEGADRGAWIARRRRELERDGEG